MQTLPERGEDALLQGDDARRQEDLGVVEGRERAAPLLLELVHAVARIGGIGRGRAAPEVEAREAARPRRTNGGPEARGRRLAQRLRAIPGRGALVVEHRVAVDQEQRPRDEVAGVAREEEPRVPRGDHAAPDVREERERQLGEARARPDAIGRLAGEPVVRLHVGEAPRFRHLDALAFGLADLARGAVHAREEGRLVARDVEHERVSRHDVGRASRHREARAVPHAPHRVADAHERNAPARDRREDGVEEAGVLARGIHVGPAEQAEARQRVADLDERRGRAARDVVRPIAEVAGGVRERLELHGVARERGPAGRRCRGKRERDGHGLTAARTPGAASRARRAGIPCRSPAGPAC